jgi:hypothetical protein
VDLLEQVVRRAGGSPALGIPAESGLATLELHPAIFKNLGIGYEILARTDPSFVPRTVAAWELFLAKTPATDPDVPAARAYVERSRASKRQ